MTTDTTPAPVGERGEIDWTNPETLEVVTPEGACRAVLLVSKGDDGGMRRVAFEDDRSASSMRLPAASPTAARPLAGAAMQSDHLTESQHEFTPRPRQFPPMSCAEYARTVRRQHGRTPEQVEAERQKHAAHVGRYGWDAGRTHFAEVVFETREVRMVECIETGERFARVVDAAERYGISAASVTASMQKRRSVRRCIGGPKRFRRVGVIETVLAGPCPSPDRGEVREKDELTRESAGDERWQSNGSTFPTQNALSVAHQSRSRRARHKIRPRPTS